MTDIVLTTLNAKYAHASLGLRYLLANMGELQERTRLIEFDIQQRPLDVAETILAHNPRIVGLGVYIWNVTETTGVVAALKRIQPNLIIILGGPEVSYEAEQQDIVRLADHVITGEADLTFAEVCRGLLKSPAATFPHVLPAPLPESLSTVAMPYRLYSDEDVAHRVIYVEASRGCPFTCEFCLSSLDIPVRNFPLPHFLDELDLLMKRGARQFKFVDRTFNLNLDVSRTILNFFHERLHLGLFLHFEMVPDRLPTALRDIIKTFPAGTLQFEVGIQTFDEVTSKNISRRQDLTKLADNLAFLRDDTGVHVHADLIVGLPGESIETFGSGFDRLVALRPHEIQVGILKRLRGTPIVRHDAEWQMVYSAIPPYEILQNKLIRFSDMQRMRRFARYWDLVANSGSFIETTPRLWQQSQTNATEVVPPQREESPFKAFLAFSDWLQARLGRQHGIALDRLAESIFVYLATILSEPPVSTAEGLWRDYQRAGRRDIPTFLVPHLPHATVPGKRVDRSVSPKRQARHLMG